MTEAFYKLPQDLEQDIENYARDVERFLSGDLSASIFRARRVPRGIYEQRQDGRFMARVRIAGGTLTWAQMINLADLSSKYGNGILHVTTRQDVQLHEVAIKDTPAIMRQLKNTGLTSKGGGGNTVRNICACPLSGICKAEFFDVTGYAHTVTEYLITLPGSYNLPRKYKIAFSGCGADCAMATINDVGFIAKVQDGKPGFSVYAGGGMGAYSRIADMMEPWLPASEVIHVAEAVRRIFDRTGNRRNKHKARLRFVFDKIGAEEFRELLKKELQVLKSENIPTASCADDDVAQEPQKEPRNFLTGENIFEEHDGVRIIPQKQAGYVALPLYLSMGHISAEDFRALAEICRDHSMKQEARTTQQQNMIIPFIKEDDISTVIEKLRGLSVDMLTWQSVHGFTVCAGASTCRLGLCLSRNAVKACADAIDKRGIGRDLLQSLKINVNGCSNACGQHPIGEIGMLGVAQRVNNRLTPCYHIALGARVAEGKTRLSESIGMVPARSLPEFIAEVISEFDEARTDNESFSSYYDRTGREHFVELLRKFESIPDYATAPEFYRDWGQSEDFSLAGRGSGECGSGVFEVIEEDMTLAKKEFTEAETSAGPREHLYLGVLAAARSLLIVRGIDSSDHDIIFHEFESHFIDEGLVNSGFRDLIARARGYHHGWEDALDGRLADCRELLDCMALLFSTLDADLKFHPPEGTDAGKDGKETADADAGEADEKVETLDLSGVVCPMNFVKAKLKLEGMEIGSMLTVILDEGEPVRNVPASFENEGQDIVETADLGDGHWRVVVRKIK